MYERPASTTSTANQKMSSGAIVTTPTPADAEALLLLTHIRAQDNAGVAEAAGRVWIAPLLASMRPGARVDARMLVGAWVLLLDDVRPLTEQNLQTLYTFAMLGCFTRGVQQAVANSTGDVAVAWRVGDELFTRHLAGPRATRAHVECVLYGMDRCCQTVREYAFALSARNAALLQVMLLMHVWSADELVAAGKYLYAGRKDVDRSDLAVLSDFYVTLLTPVMHATKNYTRHVRDALETALSTLLTDKNTHGAALAMCYALDVANVDLAALRDLFATAKMRARPRLSLDRVTAAAGEPFMSAALRAADALGLLDGSIVVPTPTPTPPTMPAAKTPARDVYLVACGDSVEPVVHRMRAFQDKIYV